jgi:hypothetical protein
VGKTEVHSSIQLFHLNYGLPWAGKFPAAKLEQFSHQSIAFPQTGRTSTPLQLSVVNIQNVVPCSCFIF